MSDPAPDNATAYQTPRNSWELADARSHRCPTACSAGTVVNGFSLLGPNAGTAGVVRIPHVVVWGAAYIVTSVGGVKLQKV